MIRYRSHASSINIEKYAPDQGTAAVAGLHLELGKAVVSRGNVWGMRRMRRNLDVLLRLFAGFWQVKPSVILKRGGPLCSLLPAVFRCNFYHA